jgi:hypothetical protein
MNKLKTTELIAWYSGEPEFNGEYLIKYSYDTIVFGIATVIEPRRWYADHKRWCDHEGNYLRSDIKVIAFAPLPKGP